jgi:hypothetical protein
MKYYSVSQIYAAGLVVVLLSGCQSSLSGGFDQEFYRAPGGTKLILKQDITIPASQVKTFFQNGRQVPGVNEFQTFCRSEVLPLKDTPQVVRADEFSIKRSGKLVTEIVQNETDVIRPRFQLVARFDENPKVYGITMFLQSASQPDVYRMICGQRQDPISSSRAPSLAQIRAALGDTFELAVPAGNSGGQI